MRTPYRWAAAVLLGLAPTSCGGTTTTSAPVIVHPGAPGQADRPPAAVEPAGERVLRYGEADVRFMTGMIAHHAQALDMTALVPTRTSREEIRLLARRIELTQADEIALMQRWLRARGEAVPAQGEGGHHADHGDPHAHHAHHGGHGAGTEPERMHGMLSDAEMARLAAASGEEFDRLFLEFMIQHHAGALDMVDELFAAEDGGQDGEIFQFAADVAGDQRMEIARMRRMRAALGR